MSRHEGVSCDSCLKSNFNGRRFKCLICYDYDLCADCYEEGATTTRHLAEHPMQCILTRNDIELFFGGEILGTEQPQSYTCPYCKKMGFSDVTLSDHVSAEHTETSSEVVCPVCAGLPGGEPNLVTDDFAGHLTLEHRQGPRELISFLDEPSAIRHGGGVRRIPGRALGGPRSRRSNMHFSSSSGISAISPSGRESVDPIAELLSQLSGVRRGGPQSSQLQQLQMQIQLERQQVTATRQQLERLPRRAHPIVSSSNSSATMAEVVSSSNGGPIGSNIGVVASNTANSGNGNNGGGGSSSCRNNEWSVNVSSNGQQQGGLTSAAINGRDANGIGFSFASNGNGSTNNALGIIIGGVAGSSTATANGNLNQVNTSSANGASLNGPASEAQSQFLLTKFIQPSLSDEEWAAVEKERAERSQFVQALLLSMLSRSSLDLSDTTEEDITDAQNASSAGPQKTNGDKTDKFVAQYPQKQENESIIGADGSDKIEQGQPQTSFPEIADDNSNDSLQQKKSPVASDHLSKQNQLIHQEQTQQKNHLNHQQQTTQQRQASYAAKKKQSKAPIRTASSSNAASAVANVIAATTSASVATVGMLNIGNKPASEKTTEKQRGRPPPVTSGVLSVVTSSQSQQPHLQLQLEQEQQQLNNSNSHNHQPTQSQTQSQPLHHQHHQQPQHQTQTQNQQQQPPNHKTGTPTTNTMSSSASNQIPDSR